MNIILRKKRNRWSRSCRSVLFAIVFMLLWVVNVQAESYEALYPCLTDLPGWEAKEPEGMKMEMPGMKMINATRSYTQGNKEITVVIVIGNQAMSTPMGAEGMKMETPEEKVTIERINGFMVQNVYDKKDNEGTIIVYLNRQGAGPAIFSFSFKELSEDEALNLAKTFDWEMMQNKAKSF